MLFTTNWLSSVLKDVKGKVSEEAVIEKVFTDSRVKKEQSLFIPIQGENFDGHQFVDEAIANGAIAVIWDRKISVPESIPPEIPVFLVDDTLQALQELATQYRQKVNPKVIGITGSNGKTTTKDMVASVMQSTYRTHHTVGNYNNEIGLPLTILDMPRDTEVLVLEMGMSAFGEIELLSKIAKPDHAIITNIGESHIEFLGSREGIAKAKLEIISGLSDKGILIVDGDEPLLQQLHIPNKVISCGFDESNDLSISKVAINHNITTFTLSDSNTYTIPLLGKHHAKNATYAVMIGKLLQVDTKKIFNSLENLKITSMRFELLKGKNGVSLINDAYNASPTSMKAAIEVVKEIQGFKHKVLVLGDVFELGGQSKDFHRTVSEVIKQPITELFTIGNDAEVISNAIRQEVPTITSQHFQSQEELIQELQSYLNEDTLILFKASRGMKLELIIEKLLK
ncbi:UDP-N-acetylmuramoyl-tripeptide--D-alanyl-D-alanine ligase [Ornithinibacillus halophilus]|nr:UDP-N-acetylmuramoyl-tripeptide--D-alanyl-D-alanine ligase [Ornithinibacillus halophilus]